MRQNFEEELTSLHDHFSEMGTLVDEAIGKSVKSFTTHDKELAQKVIDQDYKINEAELLLENKCFELIALQQPVTSDLRRIVTVMKACVDLERMGDHAVSIAKSTIRVKGKERIPQMEEKIHELSIKVKVLVQLVLEAYLERDDQKARKIAESDDAINTLSKEIFERSIKEMRKDTNLVIGGTDYLLVAKNLERIGDYVTNICEWIIYLETGKIAELNSNHLN
ncbi:phosphate signaling complex protein PhoU [Carnobacterium sp. TMP28]|uniref:phosphate signaling complex protein PhoU n=1 Tax=Carnobacterium sp. TMP28 TaxID=3397060 RepID=UPI0039DF5E2B